MAHIGHDKFKAEANWKTPTFEEITKERCGSVS